MKRILSAKQKQLQLDLNDENEKSASVNSSKRSKSETTQNRSSTLNTWKSRITRSRSTTKSKGPRVDGQRLTIFQPSTTYDLDMWIERVRRISPEQLRDDYHKVCKQTAIDTKSATCHAFTTNIKKNRYGDITVFDKTRVSLENGAYINASFVVNSTGKRYICAQAPKNTTLADFWWMVWREKVTRIAMLCSTEEEGKRKCLQYWPKTPTETLSLDKFKIQNFHISRSDMPDAVRSIQHFQFHEWPDRGMPQSEQSICDLIDKIKRDDITLKRTPSSTRVTKGSFRLYHL